MHKAIFSKEVKLYWQKSLVIKLVLFWWISLFNNGAKLMCNSEGSVAHSPQEEFVFAHWIIKGLNKDVNKEKQTCQIKQSLGKMIGSQVTPWLAVKDKYGGFCIDNISAINNCQGSHKHFDRNREVSHDGKTKPIPMKPYNVGFCMTALFLRVFWSWSNKPE